MNRAAQRDALRTLQEQRRALERAIDRDQAFAERETAFATAELQRMQAAQQAQAEAVARRSELEALDREIEAHPAQPRRPAVAA